MSWTRTITDDDDTLIAGILSRLSSAAQLAGITILDQDDPRLLDLAETALSSLGLVIVVMGPELREDEDGLVTAGVRVWIEELVRQNRSAVGTESSARAWAKVVWALLQQHAIEPWGTLGDFAASQQESSEETLVWMVTCTAQAGSDVTT